MPRLRRFPKYYPPLEDSHEETECEAAFITFSPQEFGLMDAMPQKIVPQPVISQEVVSGQEPILQEPISQQVHPPGKCVYKQTRDMAEQFAQSMMSTCFTSKSDTRRIIWTDASLKNKGHYYHGGIAVAQLSGTQWTIHHAHVMGLTNTNDLEALAVMTALETALEDEPARTREALIFCDNEQVLNGLETYLASFSAMQHAVQVYESAKDRRHAIASLRGHYDIGRMERPNNGNGSLSSSIRERTLAAYYQLLERGTNVQFHWVPAHRQILGNDVADQWARYACRWSMNAITAMRVSLSDVMMFPLATVHLECDHLGLPMMGETITKIKALESFERFKDLRYSLSTSNRLVGTLTSTTTAIPRRITAIPLQLQQDQMQTAVNQPEAAVQGRALNKRRKRRRCQKCGRRSRHTAAQCEQRSLRAACGLVEGDKSHTGDECFTTRSTTLIILIIADRLCQKLPRWRDLRVEVITNVILMLLIYVYKGGLAWLAFWKGWHA